MYGDNAFYLNKIVAKSNFNFIGNIQFQGLLEYLVWSISNSGELFLILYKFLIIFTNFLFFYIAFYSNRNKILIIFTFTVSQFYLAPSMFSLSVAGFSCIYLSAKEKSFILVLYYYFLSIFFFAYELPNPKYLILGYTLYLYLLFINNYENKVKKILVTTIILIIILLILLFSYINNNKIITHDYVIKNIELLDLVGRGYLSAIIPYKQNRNLSILYISILSFFLINLYFYLKENNKKNIIIILIFAYISLGILEPFGIINYFVNNISIFGFLRTRAGFDLMFFMGIFSTLLSKSFLQKYLRFSILFFCIILLFQIPNLFSTAKVHYNELKIQGKTIDFFNNNLNIHKINCYVTNSKYYNDNSVFNFGPPINKLIYPFKNLEYDNKLIVNLNYCNTIVFDVKEVNFYYIISLFNYDNFVTFNNYVILNK